jgi:altronate dehydratase small subunit
MKQSAILLHPEDDVATALVPLKKGQEISVSLGERSETLVLLEDIEFGHKFALRPIAQGTEVLKYGLPIGKALNPIQVGEWVHVHNCRSERFGFRHEKYGIIA